MIVLRPHSSTRSFHLRLQLPLSTCSQKGSQPPGSWLCSLSFYYQNAAVCPHMLVCAQGYGCPERPEGGALLQFQLQVVVSPLMCGCQEPNSNPLQMKQVLLTPEPVCSPKMYSLFLSIYLFSSFLSLISWQDFVFLFFFIPFFEKGSHYVVLAGLKLTDLLSFPS